MTTTTEIPDHPAKFSEEILSDLRTVLHDELPAWGRTTKENP